MTKSGWGFGDGGQGSPAYSAAINNSSIQHRTAFTRPHHLVSFSRELAERVVTVPLAQGAAQLDKVAEPHGGRGAGVTHGLGAQVEGAVAVAGVDQRGQQHLGDAVVWSVRGGGAVSSR